MAMIVNVATWSGKNDPEFEEDCIGECTEEKWNNKTGYYEFHIILSEKKDMHIRFRLADLIAELVE